MKKITYVLSALVLILSLWAVALWVLPIKKYNNVTTETRYGMSEGMQLVEQTLTNGERQYVVEDARAMLCSAFRCEDVCSTRSFVAVVYAFANCRQVVKDMLTCRV